jgi:hypothetical protein
MSICNVAEAEAQFSGIRRALAGRVMGRIIARVLVPAET